MLQRCYFSLGIWKNTIRKIAAFEPNTYWNSSGTTNLLSYILRSQFKTQEYLDFLVCGLIDKIGMHSMVIEADMAGNYVGSSYGWATTRDWSKFGLLYLHKGNWNGADSRGKLGEICCNSHRNVRGAYGAQFWLNAGGKFQMLQGICFIVVVFKDRW
jgi:CubicO group peptidase (beta-lactamase class C family)